MIKALKFYIMAVIIGLIISFLSILLICCNGGLIKDLEIHEDGYFRYVIAGAYKDPVIAIVGFTASGLEQESIEIPREIDGKSVRYIGHNDDVRHNIYYVYSENLKKIYIHDNIRSITNFEKGRARTLGNFENGEKIEIEEEGVEGQVSVMICSLHEEFGTYNTSLIKDMYYYGEKIDEININRNLSPANVVFMNNYADDANEGYYRLDNIEAGETISEPPKPVRNGYELIGWYTESECINAWDFNVSPVMEEGAEFRLYAAWRSA